MARKVRDLKGKLLLIFRQIDRQLNCFLNIYTHILVLLLALVRKSLFFPQWTMVKAGTYYSSSQTFRSTPPRPREHYRRRDIRKIGAKG